MRWGWPELNRFSNELEHWLNLNERRAVTILFLAAMSVRLLFSFHFQIYYFGELTFSFRDTSSYLDPMLNLLNFGNYQGDMFLDDSKFFRVPVYPVILGLVHNLFGPEKYEYAMAIIQSVLDSCSVLLVFAIFKKLTGSMLNAVVSSLIYLTYPFVILWVPILYTEVLSLFFIWLLVFLIVHDGTKKSYFTQGVVCAILLLTKQYLGLFLILPILSILSTSSFKEGFRGMVVLGLGFAMLSTPWILRNTLQAGELTLLRGQTTGLRFVQNDFESFERFVNLFDENITPAVYEVASNGTLTLHKHGEFRLAHADAIKSAVSLAHKCGDSFVERRNPTSMNLKPFMGCKDEVALEFDSLAALFWKEVPFWQATETRRDSLYKVFAKSDVERPDLSFPSQTVSRMLLFKYRQFLLLLGLMGVFMSIRIQGANVSAYILVTSIAFYTYFTLILVHAEMRYLVVPDIMLSVFAGLPIVAITNSLKRPRIGVCSSK